MPQTRRAKSPVYNPRKRRVVSPVSKRLPDDDDDLIKRRGEAYEKRKTIELYTRLTQAMLVMSELRDYVEAEAADMSTSERYRTLMNDALVAIGWAIGDLDIV
jgi:hypothetical protein